jgi:hypothetical protein
MMVFCQLAFPDHKSLTLFWFLLASFILVLHAVYVFTISGIPRSPSPLSNSFYEVKTLVPLNFNRKYENNFSVEGTQQKVDSYVKIHKLSIELSSSFSRATVEKL